MRINPSFALLALLALAPVAAKADNVSWTTWDPTSFQQTCPNAYGYSNCQGGPYYYPAIATGTAYSVITGKTVTVTLNGLFDGVTQNATYTPTSTYMGGSVSNAPVSPEYSIQLRGGLSAANGNYYYQDTITFSAPVSDPVFAIWSLGQAGTTASFVFDSGETLTLEATGYGQYSDLTHPFVPLTISPDGLTVSGAESYGVVKLKGTYSSITFTTPVMENYFMYTVGSSTPEPSSLALLGTGLLGVFGAARRKFKA